MSPMKPTLAIIIEKTGTISSPWVWGEEILALALARALGAHFDAWVTSEERASQPGMNVDVALHFREKFPLIGRRNLLWLQNGLESFHTGMSDEQWMEACIGNQIGKFDIIAACSADWCQYVRERGGKNLYFPQFTDPQVYAPTREANIEALDIVYVSNNIKGEAVNESFLYPLVERFGAQCRIGIFGGGWQTARRLDLLRPYLRGALPSHQVPGLYSSAKVVLSLHLPSHRRFGIVTSRVFEALACGAVVVSDAVPNNDDIMSGCLVGHDADELASHVERALLWSAEARAAHAARVRQLVVENHSAEVRARALLRALAVHGMEPT